MKEYLNKLDDYTFFKGDKIDLSFEWYYENGSPIDLKRAEVRFYLFPFGNKDFPVQFDGKDYKVGISLSDQVNLCGVTLKPEETQYLDAQRFVYQPILYVSPTEQYVRGEGNIIFLDSHP